ncbi:MAG: hypothetical protein J3R72DRAFT_437604 [Linnemannia gamsii]|nr:MAG: hypothetical protein J3R72DRAFT_437604 [Linnemannia gamsii]
MFEKPTNDWKRQLFNAIVSVPVCPAGISLPYDPEGDFTPTFSVRPPRTIFFTLNIDPPVFLTKLPSPGDRYGSTSQLALCNELLRRYYAPTAIPVTTTTPAITAKALNPAQLNLVQPILQNEEEPKHVFRLSRKVVYEFIAAPKNAESISEVVLLGPSLERDDYRRLLYSLITEFEGVRLLSIELLQGMVHMVECAEPFYLLADDLVKILAVLRIRLQHIHMQTTDHVYHLVLAVSRIVDVMVEGRVREMSRVNEHQPFSKLLEELSAHPEMCLRHQATYALQGLLHISNDESRRDLVLRHAGSITMGLLGVASLCKLNITDAKDGAEQLCKVGAEIQDVISRMAGGVLALNHSGEDMVKSIKSGILTGGHRVWYTALREAREHIQKGRLADFNRLVLLAPCCRELEFQWGICQLLCEIAIDPLWDVFSTLTYQGPVRLKGSLRQCSKESKIFQRSIVICREMLCMSHHWPNPPPSQPTRPYSHSWRKRSNSSPALDRYSCFWVTLVEENRPLLFNSSTPSGGPTNRMIPFLFTSTCRPSITHSTT